MIFTKCGRVVDFLLVAPYCKTWKKIFNDDSVGGELVRFPNSQEGQATWQVISEQFGQNQSLCFGFIGDKICWSDKE